MKNKKFSLFLLVILLATSSVFAHGKNDVEEIDVENLNSWQESFDLEAKTKKKAVKYNIMVTATDLGGNVHVEGPYNLYVDPKSDLPVCGITNPYENMRVVGNLNIVGTCVDDDGVSKVVLLLDEGTDHEKQVVAQGKEFWSYYLDTNKLEEGPHTIKVIGYDTNDEPKESAPVTLTWQLDRKQPLTAVTSMKDKKMHENPPMGTLVSGTVNFKGTVTDGNGIKELYYSTDNGDFFSQLSLSKTKEFGRSEFSVSVDTRKFDDGPSVIWFKAVDHAGSIGYYSFLYYIDNTKPDVSIVYPTNDDVMNGKFTVAGYAKDSVGLEKLMWTFGTETAEIPIIPGNPYWAVDVDTTGAVKEKARKFTISALDIAGNLVEVTKNISLNQENDKPVVTIATPTAEKIYFGDDENVFVRGIAVDDDAVSSVKMSLDGGEEIIQETRGSFSYDFCKASDLTAGNHKITVVAVDSNGVEGNPVTVQFVSKGVAPTFSDQKITVGKDAEEFVNGMEIHPESGRTYSVTAASGIGIKNVHTQIKWGNSGLIENDYVLKNVASYTAAIPVTVDFPKGVVQIVVSATDTMDRVSESKSYIYVTNTSLVKNDDPIVVFSDSTVEEDGGVILNAEYPVSGYVLGGDIASVELDPPSDFIKSIEVKGNQLKLIPDMSKIGGSTEPSYVVVKTTKGKTAKSEIGLIFKNDTEIPVLKLNEATVPVARDFIKTVTDYDEEGNESVSYVKDIKPVTGTVSCQTGVGKVFYKVIGAVTPVDAKGLISKISTVYASDEYPVTVDESGNFSFVPSVLSECDYGLYVIEVIAESAGGNQIVQAEVAKLIPPTDKKAKVIAPKFIESYDFYALVPYQGEQAEDYAVFPRSEMIEGANAIAYGKTKFTANKAPTLSADFATVDDLPYFSGMPVALAQGPAKTGSTVRVAINTGAVVSSVNWEITGEEVPGGDQSQKGAAKLTKPAAGETVWYADIPLINLPSRINNISVTIKAGSLEKVIRGSVKVVRSIEGGNIDDAEKIYPFADEKTVYDTENANWVLKDGSKYYFYANLTGPITAELENGDGLKIEAAGKFITLSAEKDGIYKGVKLVVKDRFGDTYTSEAMNFLADSQGPAINLETPAYKDWLGNVIKITGTAADALGVRSVEYSFNNGATWHQFTLGGDANGLGVTYSDEVDISMIEDGLFQLDIRALDNAGHTVVYSTACYKDTTPPEAKIIEPLNGDKVNGENLIVFKVTDNAWFNKAEYSIGGEKSLLDLKPLIQVYVGVDGLPLSDQMMFIFTDDAGNQTEIGEYEFVINNASDLPRTEIHVPEEYQVVTRDFTISGVIYDDDGPSTVYYAIDDGDFKQVSTKEVYGSVNPAAEYTSSTSFSIDVPLSTLTDNEHTVTVYAVDINGVMGIANERTFRVSLEEPLGSVVTPTIDTSVRAVTEIKGVASDKNGISKVEVSLDNGNSYNDAEGGENWVYRVDTRAIPGGTQVVFLRVTDGYGIKGLYSSLINVDNQAPDISLELPLDDSYSTGQLLFAGYAFDNVDIAKMYVTIRNLEKTSDVIVRDFKTDRIISQVLDISDLNDGFYNIELTGEDMAGNKTNVSRNIHLDKSMPPAVVDILYPLNGEHKNGKFNIYGQASSNIISEISTLKLYLDDKLIKETTLTDSGFWKFEMSPSTEVDSGNYDENGNSIKVVKADITDGTHKFRVDAMLENGQQIPSLEQTITYTTIGPWITLDTFVYGDFALERPNVHGTAGYVRDEDEVAYCKTKQASKEEKNILAAKSLAKIEVSYDNGKTFTEIGDSEKWAYRIENQDMPEGIHFLLFRATMKNGEQAIERIIVQIDNTAPSVRLISPNSGGHYNQQLIASGLSSDDVGLDKVTLTLRKGDKSAYEVPSFIQGLYLDVHFWGATLFDIGAGLTFFDDNVKVQFQWGQFTQAQRDAVSTLFGVAQSEMRYGGDNVFGMKILANVASVPFSYFLGHDWDWLYANVAIGAQFTRFNQSNSGRAQFLSAILGQLEFPRVVRHKATAFSAFSMYTEFAGWFIPSDVSGDTIKTFVPQGSLGFRVNIF